MIDQRQFVAPHRVAQFLFECEAALGFLRAWLGEKRDAAIGGALRARQRDEGAGEQRCGLVGVERKERRAELDVRDDGGAGDLELTHEHVAERL